ncbi:monocyte to macrophage differentiation protein-like, partial [Tropilaelaps mercedesae]
MLGNGDEAKTSLVQAKQAGSVSDRTTWPRYLVRHMCRVRERVVKEFGHIRWMNTPPRPDEPYIPTEIEHVANVVTHLLAVVPSYRGMCHLLRESESHGQQFCAVLYGSALIALFLVSTIFHSIFFSGKL